MISIFVKELTKKYELKKKRYWRFGKGYSRFLGFKFERGWNKKLSSINILMLSKQSQQK